MAAPNERWGWVPSFNVTKLLYARGLVRHAKSLEEGQKEAMEDARDHYAWLKESMRQRAVGCGVALGFLAVFATAINLAKYTTPHPLTLTSGLNVAMMSLAGFFLTGLVIYSVGRVLAAHDAEVLEHEVALQQVGVGTRSGVDPTPADVMNTQAQARTGAGVGTTAGHGQDANDDVGSGDDVKARRSGDSQHPTPAA